MCVLLKNCFYFLMKRYFVLTNFGFRVRADLKSIVLKLDSVIDSGGVLGHWSNH